MTEVEAGAVHTGTSRSDRQETEVTRTAAGRFTGEVVPPIDSSTILVVRDALGSTGTGERGADAADAADAGVEVLLLERHLDSDFAGGALVFPGGKVAPEDRELAPARWRGEPLEAWQERLGVTTDRDALGFLVAAVRETFEEVGVLLAVREDGRPVSADDLASEAFVEARNRLARRGEAWDWRPWLDEEGLVLDLGALALWSWWVTPEGQHRRFDTRFFLAAAPTGQVAEQDRVEATGVTWSRPEDALAAHERGEVTVIFPTRRNLETLARFGDVATAMRAARAGEVDQRRIVPRIVEVAGRIMVQHPDEDEPSPI